MRRPRYPEKAPLPPPLPPERRTVGQLIAEAIRLYYAHFWRAAPLGLAAVPFVLAENFFGGGSNGVPSGSHLALAVAIEAPTLAAGYVGALVVVLGKSPSGRILRAYAVAVPVFACFRLLALAFVLPGVVWLAFAGLAVPAVLVEGVSPLRALARGFALGRADAVHALGGLLGLVLVTFLGAATLAILLHTQAANSSLVAITLAQAVLLPVLLLGSALLYVDQEARLRLRGGERVVTA